MQSISDDSFQADRVVTVSAAHAVHDTYTAFLSPMLPVFIENLALSKAEAGMLTVINRFPSLVQPIIGHLADRVGLRYVVIATPGLSATFMSLLGVAPSYAILAFFLLVVGLSSATLHSVAPVIAGRLSGHHLGRGMGFWMVGGELGRTLGPLVIVSAIEFLGLEGTPWLMVGGWLASLLLYLRLKDVPDKPEGTDLSLPWQSAVKAMAPMLWPLSAILVTRAFSQAALTTYLPVLMTEEGANLWLAGISLTIMEAAGVVGALIGGSWSDRIGRRRLLSASLLLTPLMMFVFASVHGWLKVPLLLLMGLTGLSVTPVVMALVQESYPQSRALANGIYMAISFLFSSVIIVIVGAMGDIWSMRVAFLVSAGVTFLGLPFVPRLPSRRG